MKILFIGSLEIGGNSLAFCKALQSFAVEVKAIDPITLTSHESKLQRALFRTVNNALNFMDNQPINDPIMKIRGIQRLGHDRIMSAKGINQINRTIRQIANTFQPDMTFLFHSHYIDAETLDVCHRYGPNFCFFPDDAFTPELYNLRFVQAVKRLDCVVTTKSFNVPEFEALGVPEIVFANNSYSRECHHTVSLTNEDYQHFGSDIAFVGNNYETKRSDLLARLVLACPGIKFGIWGNHWSRLKNPLYWYKGYRRIQWPALYQHTHGPVICEDMSKVFAASKINLGLLKQGDDQMRIRDYQTTRSVEIPASGGFMLAEYTDEHAGMFREGHEAAYFRSFDDLVSKIHYYLDHEEERKQIAKAGLARCLNSDYTFLHRAETVLEAYHKWCVNHGRLDKATDYSAVTQKRA